MSSSWRATSALCQPLLIVVIVVLASSAVLEKGFGTPGLSLDVISPQPSYALGSRVVVYARVTLDGSPYAGAVVLWELKDPSGVRKDFGQATVNATGYATIAIFTSPAWPQGDYALTVAVSGTDAKVTVPIKLRIPEVSIISPQPSYALGSRVVVYARVTLDGSPYAGAVVLWELKDPSGVRKDFGQATVNATGYATIAIQSARSWPPGPYSILVSVSGTEARKLEVIYLKRAFSKLVIAVSPPSTWRGNNITVSGYVSLDPAPADYSGISVRVFIDGSLKWTLGLRPNGLFTSPSFNTSMLLSGTHEVKVELEETGEYFGGVNTTIFRIDRVLITSCLIPVPNRVNANSTQVIGFELRYESDLSIFTNLYGNKVWINGTEARFQDGWWFVTYRANLGRFVFEVTGIQDNERTMSQKFFWAVKPPSVIWDAVVLKNWTINDVDARVDVNSTQSIYVFAYYWYDREPLQGQITLNGTFSGEKWVVGKGIEVNVTHRTVASTVYIPTRVLDYKYGLSSFMIEYQSPPNLVWDMILVDASAVSDTRVDIESTQWVRYRLLHAYDQTPVTSGVVLLGGIPAVHLGQGWWEVEVTSPVVRKVEVNVISVFSQFGITRFKVNAPVAYVIFDRVVFEVSAPARVNVGTALGDRLKVTAYYEFDRAPFEGTYNVTPSPNVIFSDVSTVEYRVTGMLERKHGLTRFISSTATVKYDRLIVTGYTVDNNKQILEFSLAYDSDKAAAFAEVRVVTVTGEVLAVLTSTSGGTARLNLTAFLSRLEKVSSIIIEPIRSKEYEVTVGVRAEVPVRTLQRVISIDPRCQREIIVRVEPELSDGRIARAFAQLDVNALEVRRVGLRTGETISLVLKPGTNTLTLVELQVENTDVIIPNIKTYIGSVRAFNVAMGVDLQIPSFQFTGDPQAVLSGVVGLLNTGNVTLCEVVVVVSLERDGAIFGRGQSVVSSLQPQDKAEFSIFDLGIKVAYLSGNFTVSVFAYYEPGYNVLSRGTTQITFMLALPSDLAELSRKRDQLIGIMPEWDRKFFIEKVDQQIRLFQTKGTYSKEEVTELGRRLNVVRDLISLYGDLSLRLQSLKDRYKDLVECMGIALVSAELERTVDIWRLLRHDEALTQMRQVDNALTLLEELSIDLSRICLDVALLPTAQKELLQRLVADAIKLVFQGKTSEARGALTNAIQQGKKMAEAWLALKQAEEAVARAEAEGRTWGLERALSLLDEAKALFERGEFDAARDKALDAKAAADSAVSLLNFLAPIVLAAVAIAFVGFLIYRAIRVRRALRA